MSRYIPSRPLILLLALAVAAAVTVVPTSIRSAGPGQDAQQNQQQQGQSDQGQSQGQAQSQSQDKQKKKGGGFFGGLKAATGSSSQQTSATVSAGTKGVGEGAQIGDLVPTAADRQAVTQMENYSVAQGDLNQFIQGGHLKPKQ